MRFLIRKRGELPFVLVVLMLLLAAMPALGQTAGGLFATRAELEQLLASQSASGGGDANGRHLGEYVSLAMIRQRLEEGDFHPGDEIQLHVERFDALSQTFVVDPSRAIVLPEIGPISLRGVLRSELQEYLTQSLARFINDPVVRAETTIRVVVLGGVGKPGYYSVPPHAQVTEVLALAGGTTRNARLNAMRVERGDKRNRVLAGERLHQAVIAGRTLDQLGIQAGDHFVIPEGSGSTVRNVLTWTSTVAGVVYLIVRISKWL